MKTSTVLFAGGGTGGHIYPALAIAKTLKGKAPHLDIHFVGAKGGLEESLVPREGWPLHLLSAKRFGSNTGWRGKLSALCTLPFVLISAWVCIFKLRPLLVFGVGGYAAFPVCFIAGILRIPMVIWEPNAIPGRANRLLSFFSNKSLVVFSAAKDLLHGTDKLSVGMPIREEIERLALRRAQDSEHSGLENPRVEENLRRFRILVFGGSQGARSINKAVVEMTKAHREWLQSVELVHQTGSLDFETIKAEYQSFQNESGVTIEVLPYLHDMPKRYEWADLIVSRSGTGTLSEIAAMAKPSILIPFPFAADDHQRKNAEQFLELQACEMLLNRDLSQDSLFKTIEALRLDPNLRKSMARNVFKFFRPHAADEVAEILLQLTRMG